MKKLLCTWMAVVLLLMTCPTLAETDSAIDALIDQLDAYLAFNEQLYAIRAGVYQAVESFYERQDYESLLSLRIASDQGQEAINDLTAPAFSLSDEEIHTLIQLGVETDAVEMELQGIPIFVNDACDNLRRYEARVEEALLHREHLNIMYQIEQIDRQLMALEMQYVCDMVNYLLLPIAGSAQAGALWEAMPQRYPALSSVRSDWESDSYTLVMRFVQIDDAVADLQSQWSKWTGKNRYVADQVYERIQQGDLDALKTDALVIDGMPSMAPLPSDWLYPEDSTVFVYSEDPEGLPKTMTLWDSNVPLKLFDEYAQMLLDIGATIYNLEGSDEEGWKYALVYDQQGLMLQWDTLECASITYEPAFLSLESSAYILCCQ